MISLSLREVVGGGYDAFWHDRSRYRLLKGGRASKKSKTTALNLIVRLMRQRGANLLCVRQTANTLQDSVFADLLWAIQRLGAERFWQATRSPLRMKYLPFGNEILFKGLDDPLKLTSLTVPNGALCWIWVEEAFEISRRTEFDKLDLVLRGQMPKGLFKQVTLTFNPWLRTHWLYTLYNQKEDVFAQTTSYLDNEFLDVTDRRLFERMRERQPERYRVEGLGEWGSAGLSVFKNVTVAGFDETTFDRYREGLDWGFAADPLAWVRCHFDRKRHVLYVTDELYRAGLSNRALSKLLRERSRTSITADSAEPKSIAELRSYGFRVTPARKGPGSVESGLRWLQGLEEIVVHPRCRHAASELLGLCFAQDRFGGVMPQTVGDDHLVDALRYALEGEGRRQLTVNS